MAGSRFQETKGGAILDRFTGTVIARIEVTELDTSTALRVSQLILDALHREFGPTHLVNVVPDRG
ncbi:hypothetical protein [Paracoccus aestuariivivens]|uniref:Uncharacterized protein n=1 Tax=Paracoccus aestuariivivens TaxID=1820333 RepID=A0A6L6J6S9_9RHOB|nr:hypothetical protein [Paracoccus aestuariivivens]MTH76337.1 hypothetical protein [Paracoccus aestuariivivens]